jgi:hypothetical protein
MTKGATFLVRAIGLQSEQTLENKARANYLAEIEFGQTIRIRAE